MNTVLLAIAVILLTVGFLTAVNFLTASIVWRKSSRLNVQMAKRLNVQMAKRPDVQRANKEYRWRYDV
jgi:hypothetical protein